MNKFNTYKVCFVCTGNACRSPFAECVTKALLYKEGMKEIETFSLGTLDWGKNPRDTVMVETARRMGYSLSGTTTHMTHENLMDADCIIVAADAKVPMERFNGKKVIECKVAELCYSIKWRSI